MEDNKKKKKEEVKVETPSPVEPKEENITLSKAQFDQIQEQIKRLEAAADKGRLFNYDSSKVEKKPLIVKLSKYRDGIIVGWRTIKDELVKHPTTGLIAGEIQEYELLIDKNGTIEKAIVHGYPAFTDARYMERIEVEVVSKKESFQGDISFDLRLPDNRVITLDSRFIN